MLMTAKNYNYLKNNAIKLKSFNIRRTLKLLRKLKQTKTLTCTQTYTPMQTHTGFLFKTTKILRSWTLASCVQNIILKMCFYIKIFEKMWQYTYLWWIIAPWNILIQWDTCICTCIHISAIIFSLLSSNYTTFVLQEFGQNIYESWIYTFIRQFILQ